MATTDVQVLSTPGCVGCEPTKEMIARVLEDFTPLSWEEIDVTEHPDLAVRYQIMTAPVVIIGDEVAFTGVPKENALRAKLTEYTEGGIRP